MIRLFLLLSVLTSCALAVPIQFTVNYGPLFVTQNINVDHSAALAALNAVSINSISITFDSGNLRSIGQLTNGDPNNPTVMNFTVTNLGSTLTFANFGAFGPTTAPDRNEFIPVAGGGTAFFPQLLTPIAPFVIATNSTDASYLDGIWSFNVTRTGSAGLDAANGQGTGGSFSLTTLGSLTVTYDYTPRDDGQVPEPASMGLLGLGLAGLGILGRRMRS